MCYNEVVSYAISANYAIIAMKGMIFTNSLRNSSRNEKSQLAPLAESIGATGRINWRHCDTLLDSCSSFLILDSGFYTCVSSMRLLLWIFPNVIPVTIS